MKHIIYFTSKTCAPCKTLLPKVQKLCRVRDVAVNVIDIDEQPDVAARYGVMSVPTMIIGEDVITPAQARLARITDAIDYLVEG